MEILAPKKIWSFHNGNPKAIETSNYALRSDPGHVVTSYIDLAAKIAELQFLNRDHVLLFRGQGRDHHSSKGNTTLKPNIFRPLPGMKQTPKARVIRPRYDRLHKAEELLVAEYVKAGFKGSDRLKKQRILRWSTLQHYEVCATPLLDVTHSLRIALSFACQRANGNEAFLFALAVPNISGSITASAEAGLQIMRLSSVCPPAALRPHIQEGYLLGEYPDLVDIDQKGLYMGYEIDFAQRLIGKFKFDPKSIFNDPDFPLVSPSALYPNSQDPLYRMAEEVKKQLGPDTTS